MSYQKPYPKGPPESFILTPEPESPFLDEELFADMEGEVGEEWTSRRTGYQLESPFQYAFELEQDAFPEPEVEELEEEFYDEELDKYEEVDEYEFDDELYGEEFDQEFEDEALAEILADEEEEELEDEEVDELNAEAEEEEVDEELGDEDIFPDVGAEQEELIEDMAEEEEELLEGFESREEEEEDEFLEGFGEEEGGGLEALDLPTLPLPGERLELEIIDEPDTRKYLSNTRAVPYCWICSLACYLENPKWGQHGEPKWLLARKATGLLIGPSSVLAVAHNLWFKNAKGKWRSFKRIVVTPGRDGDDEPFGSVEADEWRTPKKWHPSSKPAPWDFAVIRLKKAIGDRTFRGKRLGWWGRYGTSTKPLKPTWLTKKNRRMFSAGYPLDRCGQRHLKNKKEIDHCARDEPDLWASTQWWAKGTVESVDSPPGFLLHTIDTTEGQSGSPVWYYYYDKKRGRPRRWLVGLHTGGSEFNLPDGGRRRLNHAVWIRREMLDTIAALEAQLEEKGEVEEDDDLTAEDAPEYETEEEMVLPAFDLQAPSVTPPNPLTVDELTGKLTNLVFWARNPKLRGKRLKKKQKKEVAQWNAIREKEVRPALHHRSTEVRIARLIFFSHYPEVRGKFKTLPRDQQRKLKKHFNEIRARDVRPWLEARIARGRPTSRTIFVVNDEEFKSLPRHVRTTAGAEIAARFAFVGRKQPKAPITVIFLEPDRFPESYNFSDAVVRIVDADANLHVGGAIRLQTRNARKAIRRLGIRVAFDFGGRFSSVPERLGTTAHNKQVVKISGGRRLAIPLMAAAVVLENVVSEVRDKSKKSLPDDVAKWSRQAQARLGTALGRAIAHEVRHLYRRGHAYTGLGGEEPDLVGTTGRARFRDKSKILDAIKQLEKKQGNATVVETFALTDRDAGFPF